MGMQGPVKLLMDPMIRPCKPRRPDGTGSDGAPRSSTTADFVATWSATPFTAAPAAGSAGSGNYWENVTLGTAAGIAGGAFSLTAPATPTAVGKNRAANRLAAGYYYYAVAVELDGMESEPWVYGASALGTVSSASGISVTAGQIVTVAIDCDGTPTLVCTGSNVPNATFTFAAGTASNRGRVKFRIYRYDGGTGNTAPTAVSQFKYLCTCAPYSGSVSGGGAVAYDNGYSIPGTDTAYLMTEKKNGRDGFMFAMMLPLMKLQLPPKLLSVLFGYLLFGTPIWWVPRHHMVIRNIAAS